MIRRGTRVVVVALGWDPDAVDNAIGRELQPNESAVVVEVDDKYTFRVNGCKRPDLDSFVITFDNGGTCVMCRGELQRADTFGGAS